MEKEIEHSLNGKTVLVIGLSKDPQKESHKVAKYLQENGYKINSPFQIVQDTPYSCVVKFSTDQGFIYLKTTPPALSIESSVIKILHEQQKITSILSGKSLLSPACQEMT